MTNVVEMSAASAFRASPQSGHETGKPDQDTQNMPSMVARLPRPCGRRS